MPSPEKKKPQEKKMQRLYVRVDDALYNKVKAKHPHNYSEAMRGYLEGLLLNEDATLKPFKHCWGCGNPDGLPIEQLFLVPLADENVMRFFIICSWCRNMLYQKSIKEWKVEDLDKAIILSGFQTSEGGLSGKVIPEFALLIKHFPDKFSISDNGIIISKVLSSEQINELFLLVNELEGRDSHAD